MKHNRSVLFIFLMLIVYGESQKNVGDTCVDQYTNTVGKCKPADSCESARNDFQQNGIRPTFCTYSAFGTTLVCCRDGGTILQAADAKPNRPLWGITSNKQSDGRRVSERNDGIASEKTPVEPHTHDYSKDGTLIQDTFQPISTQDSIEDRDFTIKDHDTLHDRNVPTEEELISKIWALKLKRLLVEQRRYAEKIINDILFEAEMGTLTKQHLALSKINKCEAGSMNLDATPLKAATRSTTGTSTNADERNHNSNQPLLQLKLTVNNPDMDVTNNS